MTAGYWPRPWTCEDGGPRRWGSAAGQPGLGIRAGERLEVAAVHDAFATDALVRREPGELYALRHPIPLRGPQSTPVEGWVERLDPETLEVTASTPPLPGDAWWPGGIAAHANGDLHMVFGRWAHRLTPELDVLASHRLPVPRPHNSFVVLDGGELVTKDCDAPTGREPSTVSALDPETLLPVAAPLRLAEPLDRPARLRRRERDRGRNDRRLPPAARPRRRPDRDRRLAPELRPRARAQLRLGPRDRRGARLLDGQWAQPHRADDARQRRAGQPAAPLVGAPRRRRGAFGRDQRTPPRHRVQSSGLGSGGEDRRRV